MQILEQRGPDAADFLHRITTADIKGLPELQWAPCCILSPQGKVRSAFWVLKCPANRFLLLLDTDLIATATTGLLALLEEFKFAERFEVRILDAEHIQEALDKSPLPIRPEADRIAGLNPRFGNELTEDSNPLDAGAFDWVASNKGCYPGQEVIEKIISLGSPSKNLCLLSFESGAPIPAQGDTILAGGTTVGTITSVNANQACALGIIRKTQTELGTKLSTASGSLLTVKKKATRE